MSSGPSHLAVVPAYNEAATVGSVVRSIREHGAAFDVLVVTTARPTKRSGSAEDAGARVLQHPFNLGDRRRRASRGSSTRWTTATTTWFQVDGDGQHDPTEVGRLLERWTPTYTVDMVCGSRFLSEGPAVPRPDQPGVPASTSLPSSCPASSVSV